MWYSVRMVKEEDIQRGNLARKKPAKRRVLVFASTLEKAIAKAEFLHPDYIAESACDEITAASLSCEEKKVEPLG